MYVEQNYVEKTVIHQFVRTTYKYILVLFWDNYVVAMIVTTKKTLFMQVGNLRNERDVVRLIPIQLDIYTAIQERYTVKSLQQIWTDNP